MIIPALYCGGGLQKVSLHLSQELIKRGYNITVVDEYEAPVENLQTLEIQPQFKKLGSYEITSNNLDCFTNIIKNNSIELIIYQGFIPKVSGFLKAWKKNHETKIISFYHNTPDAPMPKGLKSFVYDYKGVIKTLFYPLYYLYSRYKVGEFLKVPYLFSERVVLLSPNFIKLYENLTGLSDKIRVIPNFIRINCEKKIKKRKQLLYIGRLEEDQKKVYRIITIWEKIASLQQDWELVLAGEGRCRKQYEEYASNKQIERIKFLGYIPDPISIYADSPILLMTSDFEGFPMVLIEAMSVGCVPIAYNSFNSITDIIDDNINGILVRPFKESDFIAKLLHLMDDERYRNQLSDQAVLKAQNFSIENVLPKWEALINNVLVK